MRVGTWPVLGRTFLAVGQDGRPYQHPGGVFPLAVAGLEFFEISKNSFGARGRFWSALTASTFVALTILSRLNNFKV